MNSYIATFLSHYDACVFHSLLKDKNVRSKIMPVPRKLSASCGSCVRFFSDTEIDFKGYEVEAVFLENPEGFVEIES